MIQWKTIFKGNNKCGLCRQVVFVDGWSLKQVWLYNSSELETMMVSCPLPSLHAVHCRYLLIYNACIIHKESLWIASPHINATSQTQTKVQLIFWGTLCMHADIDIAPCKPQKHWTTYTKIMISRWILEFIALIVNVLYHIWAYSIACT